MIRYNNESDNMEVVENGSWKIRSSHWSPMQGGSGTTQVALD